MKYLLRISLSLIALLVLLAGIRTWFRYQSEREMILPVEEVTTADYPEDPADRSIHYAKYQGRSMRLIKRDDRHFDFILESQDPSVATVKFMNIDLGLYIPTFPDWVKGKPELEIITLVDREWNRQQVRFDQASPHLRVEGGNGFEQKHLYTAELARNCLNAGLWEILLFTKEEGKKTLYYQGWFTFPLCHYKKLFEQQNGVSYWKHWHRLEHWIDPVGTAISLDQLRAVDSQHIANVNSFPREQIILTGEQVRKGRCCSAPQVRCWGDFCTKEEIKFATFVAPGRYNVNKPWAHELSRIGSVERLLHKKVRPIGKQTLLDEIEVIFQDSKTDGISRFIVSGIDLQALPQLHTSEYNQGLYMPMGIGISPFYQTYTDLQKNPPYDDPYFCLLLDEKNRWINHHEVSVDGPVMHRDIKDPNLVHLYLLSYERHSLVSHLTFSIPAPMRQ